MEDELITAIKSIFPSNYNTIDPNIKSGKYDKMPFIWGILANIAVNAYQNDKASARQYMEIYKLVIKLDKAETPEEKNRITEDIFEKVFK